ANERYTQAKSGKVGPPQLVVIACHSALPGAALELLQGSDLTKDFKEAAPDAAILWASMQLALGRLEELTGTPESPGTLVTLDTGEWAKTMERAGRAGAVRLLKYQKALHAGEYKTAGELLENIEGRELGLDPLLEGLAKNGITPHDLLFAQFSQWPPL